MGRGSRTATTALLWLALSACDGGRPTVRTPPDPDAVARGRALFLEHCALCHGERGDGQGLRRGSLSRPPANFRGPLFDPDPEQVRRSIRDGIAGSDMPGWQRLGDAGVNDLTSYVLSIARDAS